jgi:uncharacterized membrane protein YgcG
MSGRWRAWLLTGVLSCAVTVAIHADEAWVIERFDIRYDIQRDGSVRALDAIDVDFGSLSKHGIYRDITYRLGYDDTRNRIYDIDLVGVTDANGRRHRASESNNGNERRFKIGDPDKTISGRQAYRVAYTIAGALNAFPDHDEFYWNATGDSWPVRTERASVEVRSVAGGIERVDCFEGFRGSTSRCESSRTDDVATFRATRPLASGEQLTVVVGLRKGVVAVPPPSLREKPHDLLHFFERSPGTIGGMALGFLVAINGVGLLWWWAGRDRRYIALQHSSADAPEERVPFFGARPVGVEFQPPENLRPGQMGLLLDERADTLDVTATIVDLAVRGYLTIEEIEPAHWFSRRDWQLTRVKGAGPDLLAYERIVLNGLFPSGATTKLSALKNKFYKDLALAKKSLYADAMERRWFAANPDMVRTWSKVAGWVVVAAGVFVVIYLGSHWGAGLLGLPVMAGGLFLVVMARAMPRRSAVGLDMMQRTLGFVRYIKTAETSQQAFAERANLFTAYLPYAVAFKCVEKWARAFRDLDIQAATAGWYTGTSGFNPSSFSSSLGTFSNSVSSAMASTPGGSGGSGFGGGSSGGGGGGGGGGSW